MASQQGLEPRIIEPESMVLPITLLGNMASGRGYAPRSSESKSEVLLIKLAGNMVAPPW